ncbi:MAG: SDR family NAD(P)-dependent oxidoreductase [SAR202 cluster bacterium]|jgi:NAD(P)-dependent dehydrogenase (short-subunit alcohol dehydrogenase family)|nr:SDR family NAD(P)-dependent oxidoreductase [SAR202 cluster bacterium]
MIGDLTGKTALVTGAGSGIGRGIATVLAEQGASVAVTDLNQEWADETAALISGVPTLSIRQDVTSTDSVDEVFRRVLAEWGALDILINNAGVAAAGDRTGGQNRAADWDATYEINVRGVVRCCEAVLPHMQGRRFGKIVNIASMAGHSGRRSGGAYAVSKAAVLRYTRGLAAETATDNINVNAICPGAVWTRFQQAGARARQAADPALADRDIEDLFHDRYDPIMPLGRPQTPEDIGKSAAFLASEDARNITGQCIHVDGGVILRD